MQKPDNIDALTRRIEAEGADLRKLREGMARAVVGQDALVRSLLVGLLADGHILLEGVPGLAKTLAVKTLAALTDATFSRIQFTPDLLPADVTGTLVFDQREGRFFTRRGPVFANFVLADEINRAPAKVQSALLEAMQERQVTLGEETHALPHPFLVLATQNPVEQEGTFRLPEAQADRFMLKVHVDYPEADHERDIIVRHLQGQATPKIQPVLSLERLEALRKTVREVYVDEKIVDYILDIVDATRHFKERSQGHHDYVALGASPRAGISLALAARALAFLQSRAYVVPDDVRLIAPDVLRHRISLSFEAEAERISPEDIIAEILSNVKVP